jgi:5-methyltetrahydrofolate--homocysteine methyltransferase
MMLEVEGYVVVDLGHNVPAKRFFEEAEERNARVVGLSTMMTTTLPFMRDTIKLVRTMESNPLVIVGGAPLSEALARELGADGYGENAAKAPELVESLIK